MYKHGKKSNIYSLYILLLLLSSYLGQSTSISPPLFHGIALYRDKAIPLQVRVSISEGEGEVSIKGVKTGPLAHHSIIEAVYMALFTIGLSPYKYNYTVEITPLSPEVKYIEGTSLSLSVYIATLATLLNTTLDNSIIATGTLNPDLSIGFVSNITEKGRGAQQWNYTMLIYPELQDREYIFVEKPVHIGPYAFIAEEIATEPLDVSNITINLVDVGWAPTAYNISSSSYLTIKLTSNLGEIVDKLQKNLNISYLQIEILDRYIVSRIEEMLVEVQIILSERPDLADYFAEDINTTKTLLAAHKTLEQYGLKLAALYILADIYKSISRVYFLAKQVVDPAEGLWQIDVELTRMETLTLTLLNQTINSTDISSIFLTSRAASLYADAAKKTRALRFTITLAQAGFYNAQIAASIAREMSLILFNLVQAIIYTTIALYTPPSGVTISLDELINNSISYADHLFKYAYQLSIYSGVYSEIIQVAGYNLWRARNFLRTNTTFSKLVALDSALLSITYSSLYFALHPGFREIAPARYFYVVETTGLLSNYTIAEPRILTAAELAYVQRDIETRILFLEEAIALAKLQIMGIAKDLEKFSTSIEASKYTYPSSLAKNSSEVTERKNVSILEKTQTIEKPMFISQLYIPLLLITITFSVVVYIILRRHERK